jgi:hypothetical protein
VPVLLHHLARRFARASRPVLDQRLCIRPVDNVCHSLLVGISGAREPVSDAANPSAASLLHSLARRNVLRSRLLSGHSICSSQRLPKSVGTDQALSKAQPLCCRAVGGVDLFAAGLRARVERWHHAAVRLSSPPIPGSVSSEDAGKLVNLVGLATLLVPVFVAYYWAIDLFEIGACLAIAGVAMISSLPVLRMTGMVWISREVFLASLFGFLCGALGSPGESDA